MLARIYSGAAIGLDPVLVEVEVEKLGEDYHAEPSATIRERVNSARKRQLRRYKKLNLPIYCNADMGTKHVKQFCNVNEECKTLLIQAVSSLGLSARSYYRVIKVAQTIADLKRFPRY
jgi:magnesium chelatase family protein